MRGYELLVEILGGLMSGCPHPQIHLDYTRECVYLGVCGWLDVRVGGWVGWWVGG